MEKRTDGKCPIIVILIIAAAAILGLGLGLGLGLKQEKRKPLHEPCLNFDKTKFNKRLAPETNGTEWLKLDCKMDEPICPPGYEKPPLVIISMDGFHADYIKRNLTPVIDKIRNCGVKTDYMRSAYPTKTFPNHYSIVTGLYPESHGIVDNLMVDLELNKLFTLIDSEKNNPDWWQGEPIWATARKSDKISATMFWPGSEAKSGGYYPNKCYMYDESVPFEMRIDQVLSWLDEPHETRPNVINVYFTQPDQAGHKYGPDSDAVNGNLTRMNNLIGSFMDGLIERKLHKCIDIMMVSDHGMTPVSCKRVVQIIEPLKGLKGFIFDGTMARITSKFTITVPDLKIHRIENGASPNEIATRLQCINYNTTKVYTKDSLPVRLHYTNNPRIGEVLVTVADQWLINGSLLSICNGGNHGYDNVFQSMHGFFAAYGSSFKQTEVEPFENIELYNIMADILNIPPSDNNGTYGRLHHILRHPPSFPPLPKPGSHYIEIMFPDDQDERERRRKESDCNCTGVPDTDKVDSKLNVSKEVAAKTMERQVGRNLPLLEQKRLQTWLLMQQDSISAYSKQHYMPLWAAFTLDDKSSTSVLNVSAPCVRVDVRLTAKDLAPCQQYKNDQLMISPSFLVPPGISSDTISQEDSRISSNIVPMYDSFREGVWKAALDLIQNYHLKYKSINVIMGPIFDNNHDGHYDLQPSTIPGSKVPLPSYYFVMLTRCSTAVNNIMNCPDDKLDIVTMLLPHVKDPGYCWGATNARDLEYLQTHLARPRDVELVSGLLLLRGIKDVEKQLRLKTKLTLQL